MPSKRDGRIVDPGLRGTDPAILFTGLREVPEPLRGLIDLDDPDVPVIADTFTAMRALHFDMSDPVVLQVGIDAARRHADLIAERVRHSRSEAGKAERLAAQEASMRWVEQRDLRSVVYYMRLGNRLKIGYTFNLAQRRADIQPEEVMATEPGGLALETQRHEQFAALHVVGEWFRLEPPLTEHIARLQAAAARPSA